MQKKLELGDNVVEFTPTRSGAFLYTCWMGMIRGRITVVDDFGGADTDGAKTAKADVNADTNEDVNEEALAAKLPPDLYPDFSAESDADPFESLFDGMGIKITDTKRADAGPQAYEPRRAQCPCCGR
jgi:hypothetical protein